MKKLILLLVLALFLPLLVQAETRTYVCNLDARINDLAPTSNYGTDTFLYVGAGSVAEEIIHRSVLAFEVAFEPNWESDSVKLKIRGTDERTTTNYYIDIYDGEREFAESKVSWDTAEAGIAWTTPGGDYGAKLDSFLFDNPNTTYTIKGSTAFSESVEVCINESRWFYLELVNKSEATVNSRKSFSSAQGGELCTLFVYGSAGGGGGGAAGGSPATPNATIVRDGGTNLNFNSMQPALRDMAVRNASGTLVTCWQNWNDTGTTIDGLVYSYSTDDGSTWSNPIRITPSQSYDANTLPVSGFMTAVGDTIYMVYSAYFNTSNDSVVFCRFFPGQSPGNYKALTRSGHAIDSAGSGASISYESGDVFWVAFSASNQTNPTTDKCSLTVQYSTNRGGDWTTSTTILISDRNLSSGETHLLHNKGNRTICAFAGEIPSNKYGCLRMIYRDDAASKTTWSAITNVETIGNVGRSGNVSLMPLDTNVIFHFTQSDFDSSIVRIWDNSDSVLGSPTTVFKTSTWTAGRAIKETQIGYAGDTIFAFVFGEYTGVTDNNLVRQGLFKKSVNGTTWGDSVLLVESPEYGFDTVWKNANGTWTDYTTAANNNTGNDLSFFSVNTDTLFFGHKVKYNYITFTRSTSSLPANGAQVLTWKYWNGSAWTTFTADQIEPSLDSFFVTTTVVTYQIWFSAATLTNWATTTVNGFNGYWIKLSTDIPYSIAVPMASVAPAIWQNGPHFLRNSPSTYAGLAYVRGGREGRNAGDAMFAKYTISAGAVVAHDARRERLLRLGE